MSNINKIIEKIDKLATNLQVEEPSQPKTSGGVELLTTLVQVQNQYRIFHWQTKSFSQHKSFGVIYEKLDESIDDFLETYFGKYGRIIADKSFGITMENLMDGSGISYSDKFIDFLSNKLPSLIDATKDTDLVNIRDTILGDVNRLKYLLTLV